MNTKCHVVVLAVLGAVGCVPPVYKQPSPKEPHAIAKVRVVNHSTPGPYLAELMQLNEFRVVLPATEGDYKSPRATALRIRLEPAAWRMQTTFYHTYTTTSIQSYTYACGKSTCTGTRTVSQTHQVTDGACHTGLVFQPVQGQMYLLQYDFFANGECRLQCLEQHPQPEGDFLLRPCAARHWQVE